MVDERIVEIRGASLKVLNALKSVLGLLRKFLVDHGVLHLFERKVIFVVVVAACFIMHQDESSFNVLMELIFLLLICRTEQQLRCRIVVKKTRLPTIMLFQRTQTFCYPNVQVLLTQMTADTCRMDETHLSVTYIHQISDAQLIP
jgi:hypothetical protein